ncbi:MAG: M28 family peptidase [Paludibacteraceae bacterium]|nr:M28 family peptidase [Paludibacteraceae bacterium]
MKKKVSLCLCLSFVGLSLFSQTEIPDSLKAPKSDEVDYAQEVVSKLCDPSMKGRGYAKNGDKLAADYIANEFKALGLQPFGTTYMQKFNVAANTFPERMDLQLNNDILMAGTDYIVDPSCPSIAGTFKPVFVTRKDISNRMVLIDKLRDSKETLMLVDNSNREGETPEQSKRIDKLIESMKTDNKVQLKGVIIYNNKSKPTWGTSSTLGIRPVIYITRETDIASVKEIKVAVDAEFKPAYETQNVVGMIKGAIKPDSFIVVTAHYDNLGMIGKDVNYFGANNSASGVAMLLTLAKHFKVISPYYSVIFIAFGGNELAYAGAQAYVASPPVPLTKIKFLVSFDLAGNGSEGIKVVNGPKYPALLTQLTKINAYYKLLPKIDSRATAPISEHSVFDEKGVPCFFIYSLGGSMAYHNLNDKPELVPFTKFANYQNLMIRFLETFK